MQQGQSRNSMSRAVFIHRLGEIRDRTYENQQHRFSGLNLLVTAIILWNTRYLEHALAALREVEDVPDHLLAHLSPLGWEHVNLTGDYVWAPRQKCRKTPRIAPAPSRARANAKGSVMFLMRPLNCQIRTELQFRPTSAAYSDDAARVFQP